MLISKGADVNARTATGESVVRALPQSYFESGIGLGSDEFGIVTTADPALTALGTAKRQGFQDVAKTLLAAGAKE